MLQSFVPDMWLSTGTVVRYSAFRKHCSAPSQVQNLGSNLRACERRHLFWNFVIYLQVGSRRQIEAHWSADLAIWVLPSDPT